MEMTQCIANAIIDKYGRKALELLSDADKFLKIINREYNHIEEKRSQRNMGMIVNADAFVFNDFKGADDLKKKTAEKMLKILYINNIINEKEYEKLCKMDLYK